MLYTIQHPRCALNVRLNITIDESIYRRLKRELPPKGISSFIEEAVRSQLRPDRAVLDAAYRAASREAWRRNVEEDWAALETAEWPG
jgi:hypothetical protein